MSTENDSSQHLMNGDTDFSLDSSQNSRLDSPLSENKSFNDSKDLVSGVSSHHIEEPTRRQKPPSNLQLSQEPKAYSPTTSASSTLQSSSQGGYQSTAPLRRVDSRSFQPAPPQRPQNPLNFQPSQNWQPRPNSGQFSPVEYRPPPQQYQPSNQQYQPANQQYQTGQYQQSSQPYQQYQQRSQSQYQQPPTSSADSTRKLTSFSPSSPTSPPLTNAPSPRPVVPGALNLRRASPWSLLREKFPPTDLTRPRLRSFQYPNYASMNPQPIQTPPPPPQNATQLQQDIQRKPENEPGQRSYLPQDPTNKNMDMMRMRSPMMQNNGRDSPTMGGGSPIQYASPTPGQGAPSPRPPVAPMQRTDSMSAMRNDPRLQQPYAPRPPRSPNKFDDDDVVMGDPRLNMGRGSPRPPVPFNKFQGQDLPKNMTPPPGEPVKYMTRPETPDRSSPMNQTFNRSPMPNNYQNSPLGTPTPPNYGTPKMSPSPNMMSSSPQSYLSKSPNPSSTDRSFHESPNMMSGKSTPEQLSRTPEVPKASPTPPPPAPTKPPEVPSKPPETPSRSSTPSERPSTPLKISPQSSNERPNTIRRSPSGRDTPFFNGVSSENSSGRTSRTESSQDGVLNAKNLEKSDENRSTPQRKRLISSSKSKDGDHDSGVDESTQGNDATTNGDLGSPKKSPTKIPAPKKLSMTSPTKTPTKTTPKTPEAPSAADKKKVPMNKVQVGAAPSPNLKTVTSKIGSLQNTSYKPGGGKVKIENRKLDWKAQPRIAAKNDTYSPGGGDKKETQPMPPMSQPTVTKKLKKKAAVSKNNEGDQIQQVKLQWNAKSKIGSLENATHKPGGGDKKIESVKLDFKDKAKPKIGSKDNMKHTPGGGTVKNSEENGETVQIEDQKLEIKASSKIGSLDNVKHRPGGGDKKIFDDKEYLKQMGGASKTGSEGPSGTQSPMHMSQSQELQSKLS